MLRDHGCTTRTCRGAIAREGSGGRQRQRIRTVLVRSATPTVTVMVMVATMIVAVGTSMAAVERAWVVLCAAATRAYSHRHAADWALAPTVATEAAVCVVWCSAQGNTNDG